MKCKKLLAIILAFVLFGTTPGMISSLAAVSEDGVIFSFDGSNYYFNWAVAGEGYGEISAIGQIATVGKSEGDLVGEGVYGQSGDTTNPTNEFRFTVQGGSWSDSDRAKYSSGYLVLTCDIFLNDAFNGFYWTRRGGNTISTKDQTVIAKFVNKNSWNTITTYYEFAANSSGNHTTKTFVNGKLVDTNTACSAITDGATNDVQDHINMHVYGTQGDTFEFDNVKYYMTNEAPDDIILSTDGTQESWTWTTILGSVSHNVQKDGTDVYTEGETVASGTDNRFLCYFSKQNYSPDTAKYDYIVMTAQIIPYNDSDITRVAWRNRDGSLSVPDSGSGSKAISDALIPGQWNTVTTVYCYDEVLSEPNPAYAKYTSYTYVNGVRVYKMTNAYSVMPSDKTTSAGNRDNWRIQLTVTTNGAVSFGLDNVKIYQTNTYPDVTMPTLENTAKYTVVGNKIKVLPGDVAISELSGAKVWDSTLTNQIATGNIADGNIVTVEDGNKITYYTVSTLKNYDVIYGGTAYDGVANTVDTGSLTATVYKPDETEISVIIAQFDKFGNLHKAKVNKVSGSGLVSTSAFAVDAMEDSVITTFVWKDMTALKPLADVVSVVYSTEG